MGSKVQGSGVLVKCECRILIMKFNNVFHYFEIHYSLFDILRFTCMGADKKIRYIFHGTTGSRVLESVVNCSMNPELLNPEPSRRQNVK